MLLLFVCLFACLFVVVVVVDGDDSNELVAKGTNKDNERIKVQDGRRTDESAVNNKRNNNKRAQQQRTLLFHQRDARRQRLRRVSQLPCKKASLTYGEYGGARAPGTKHDKAQDRSTGLDRIRADMVADIAYVSD